MALPSPARYLARNAARVAPVCAVIVFAVVGVGLTAGITGSMIASARLLGVALYERQAFLTAEEGTLDSALLAALAAQPYVDRVLPVRVWNVEVVGMFGSEQRPVLALPPGELSRYLHRTGLRLARGRLPLAGRAEVAVHEDIARARKLDLGGTLGHQVNLDDQLPGRYTVVGVLAGPYPIAVTAGNSSGPPPVAALVLPRSGRERLLEEYLARLPAAGLRITTHARQRERFTREVAILDAIVWVLNLVCVAALAGAVGLLNLLFFRQRLPEFALLVALGYPPASLTRRVAAELALPAVLAWGMGILLTDGVLALLASGFYAPRGVRLGGLDPRGLALTLPVPTMSFVVSLATVWWELRRLDVVAVMDHGR